MTSGEGFLFGRPRSMALAGGQESGEMKSSGDYSVAATARAVRE